MPWGRASEARGLAPPLATLRCNPTRCRPHRERVLSNLFEYHCMFAFAAALIAAPMVIALYAYIVYPLALWTITRLRQKKPTTGGEQAWPSVTVTVPVYNAAASIRATLQRLIGLDYPRDRLQLLVLSDASTDGTDDVVKEFSGLGVELLRAVERRGKTALENSAAVAARGDIIVNIDATVDVPSDSLKKLVRAFDDATVGVASGRDVSTPVNALEATGAESGYVGYEMWLRDLETQAGSIVGASGCFFGIRRSIRDLSLPLDLSWDFASSLLARKKGYRSVSVRDAICFVPRTTRIDAEIRRKVRTMARGIRTLFYLRELMNPVRYGGFALMLISHKLLRWVPYLLAPVSLLALGALATRSAVAQFLFVLVALGLAVGVSALRASRWSRIAPVSASAFFVAALAAGALAWWDVIRGVNMSTWEPTQRSEARVRAASA